MINKSKKISIVRFYILCFIQYGDLYLVLYVVDGNIAIFFLVVLTSLYLSEGYFLSNWECIHLTFCHLQDAYNFDSQYQWLHAMEQTNRTELELSVLT